MFRAVLARHLAQRYVELHAPQRWTNAGLEEFDPGAHSWEVIPSGTEGDHTAEVTACGVDLEELSAKTMESRKGRGGSSLTNWWM